MMTPSERERYVYRALLTLPARQKPTVRAIAARAGAERNPTHLVLKKLIADGKVAHTPGRYGSYRIVQEVGVTREEMLKKIQSNARRIEDRRRNNAGTGDKYTRLAKVFVRHLVDWHKERLNEDYEFPQGVRAWGKARETVKKFSDDGLGIDAFVPFFDSIQARRERDDRVRGVPPFYLMGGGAYMAFTSRYATGKKVVDRVAVAKVLVAAGFSAHLTDNVAQDAAAILASEGDVYVNNEHVANGIDAVLAVYANGLPTKAESLEKKTWADYDAALPEYNIDRDWRPSPDGFARIYSAGDRKAVRE